MTNHPRPRMKIRGGRRRHGGRLSQQMTALNTLTIIGASLGDFFASIGAAILTALDAVATFVSEHVDTVREHLTALAAATEYGAAVGVTREEVASIVAHHSQAASEQGFPISWEVVRHRIDAIAADRTVLMLDIDRGRHLHHAARSAALTPKDDRS